MGIKDIIRGTAATLFSIGLGSIRTTLTASTGGLAVDRPLYTDGLGGRVVEITSASSPYTPGDEYTILVDASGGAVTIALPAVATRQERIYRVFKIDTSGNSVTIDPNGAETIDGMSTYVLSTPNKGAGFIGGTVEWKFISAVSRNSIFRQRSETFGLGSDGDVTIAGSTTAAQNMYYLNLVVTGTLLPDRYLICVQERLSGTGTISDNGASAVNRSGAAGNVAGRYLAGGTAGGSGGIAAVGSAGTTRTNSISTFGGGGGGGAGGTSGANAGGAGGTISAPAASNGGPADPWFLYSGRVKGIQATGGSGGGGGGAAVNSQSGGGGAGGSFVLVRAWICDFSGTISSTGGNGAAALLLTGVGAGGGGGGGGGIVVLVTSELRTTPTTTVAGGTAGAGAGTGVAGTAGSSGYSSVFQMVQ
jgi:hypothetical protein